MLYYINRKRGIQFSIKQLKGLLVSIRDPNNLVKRSIATPQARATNSNNDILCCTSSLSCIPSHNITHSTNCPIPKQVVSSHIY